ncbi:hypothetical protein [Hyalangium versicolor]|uniref:hypothetical protein n=1 Tax=Hyalangium versicolor TaxID=2861190 RepID=UPI001CD03F09|nr:hypothetical protein [Hyalangium versicolor]
MGSFQQFLNDKQIDTKALTRLSAQLEAHSEEDAGLVHKRWAKRHDKDTQAKSYAELGIAKPRSGRGVSAQQLRAALADQPLPPRVRGKIVRAVNAVLAKEGGKPVTHATLFGDVRHRQGVKPKAS